MIFRYDQSIMDDDEARAMFLSPESSALPSFEETWSMEPRAPCQGIAGGWVDDIQSYYLESGNMAICCTFR